MTAIKTGPSSRSNVTLTMSGTKLSAPSFWREWAACIAKVTPTLKAVSATIGAARTPINTICRNTGPSLKNCPVNGATRIQ